MKFHVFSASIFVLFFITFWMENGSQKSTKIHANRPVEILTSFMRLSFGDLVRKSTFMWIYVDFMLIWVTLWLPFGTPLAPPGSKWLPLGSLWLPFGTLWAPLGWFWLPFGTLLAPFRQIWWPFRSLRVDFGHQSDKTHVFGNPAIKSHVFWYRTEGSPSHYPLPLGPGADTCRRQLD